MKLALGTAQFGMDYGIANKNGRISNNQVKEILEKARNSGVDILDTAINYGESEKCLGQIGITHFKVITKLPAVPENISNVETWIEEQLTKSLERLGLKSIHGLLLHRPEQLKFSVGKKIIKALEDLKIRGLVKKIGISVYEPKELETLIESFSIDIVQIPINIFDRRIISTGWLSTLKQKKIEIHARSVFLQGLLLMKYLELPEKFLSQNKLWIKWHQWLNQHDDITPIKACLGFVSSLKDVDRIIVGVDNIEQFEEVIEVIKNTPDIDYPNFESQDEKFLNPSNW
jgi:aryl-alcohol dehydrogenase-like predicted oxidoreductase